MLVEDFAATSRSVLLTQLRSYLLGLHPVRQVHPDIYDAMIGTQAMMIRTEYLAGS